MVENFKVGGLAKFGLDAATLRAANPRLIYASITGFGQDGPYADRAGYDYIIQGMGGMMSITGLPDGEPGGGPMRVGVAVADLFTGMYAANAILAALVRRGVTGEGATIDLALFDTQLAVLANQASNALVSGNDPPRQGNAPPQYRALPAVRRRADQPIIIAVGNDRQFARLAAILGAAEWAGDPAYRDQCARGLPIARHAGADDRRRSLPTKPAADWLEQARGGRDSGRADQPHQPGAGRSAGAASRGAGQRSAARASARCRRSARRCASTASAPMRRCRRRRFGEHTGSWCWMKPGIARSGEFEQLRGAVEVVDLDEQPDVGRRSV